MPTPSTPSKPISLVEEIMSRLPSGITVGIPDISVAMDDVTGKVIEGWIEMGEVDAIDIGGGGKRNWRINKRSFEEFLKKRNVGLRAPADRRLENQQLKLFEKF